MLVDFNCELNFSFKFRIYHINLLTKTLMNDHYIARCINMRIFYKINLVVLITCLRGKDLNNL